MEKVTIQFDADLTPLREQLGQLKSSGLQELSAGATEASTSINKLSESAKNMPMQVVAQGVDEATQSIKENSQAITENVGKQQSMKAELKDLKNKLQELEDQGKDNTKEFEQMAIRAGQLSDQIGDTSARIKVLADDSKYIKAVSQAIGGLASAYSVVQGASALFGQENKDIEKALVKVNAAMAIANGLQQINEYLQKQSTIAVVAHSAAQKLYNYFVVEGTSAMRGFRIALAATGIGAAVVALTFLYQAYQEHNEKVKEAEESTKNFGEAMKSALNQASSEVASLQLLYKAATDTNKSMAERKKAVDELQKIYPSYFANIKDEAILNGKAKKSYDELNGAILDNARAKAYTQILNDKISKQITDLEPKRQELKLINEQIATYEDFAKRAQNINDTEANIMAGRLEASYEANLKLKPKLIQQIDEINATNEQANKDLLDQILLYTNKAAKYTNDITNKSADNQSDAAKKVTQAIIDQYQIRVENARQALAETEKGTQAQLNANVALEYAQTQLAKKQVELSTDSEQLKKEKIETLNAEMYANIKQMMQDFDKSQEDSVNKQLKSTETKIKDTTDEIQAFIDETIAMNEEALANANAKMREQEKQNRERAKQETIGAIQDIANAEFEIEKNKRDAKLQAEIDYLESKKEKELSNKNLTEAQKQAIQTKYDKLEGEAKKKAWEAEKQAKKEQALINGALAVTQILATNAGNPVLAAILTASALLSTAMQVRVIESQPTPKFAKGKNLDSYEGKAIIGEAGRELRFDSDGSVKMYNRATIDHVNADSIILPNHLTEALLKTNIPAMNLRNMSAVSKQNVSAKLDIDYKKLAKTLSSELQNSQKVSVNIDEKGFETRIMNGISERKVMDNRYKL